MIKAEIEANEVKAALARLAGAVSDMKPLMQELGEIMIDRTKGNFKEGQSPDGQKWADKTPTTIAAYMARKDPVDSRPLFGPSKQLSTQIFYEVDPAEVRWGSNLIYSAVMQFGAKKGAFGTKTGTNKKGREFSMPMPWGDIPARPYLGVGAEDSRLLIEAIEEYLADAVGD